MATYSTEKCGYCMRPHKQLEERDGYVECPNTHQLAPVTNENKPTSLTHVYVMAGACGQWRKDKEAEHELR